MRRRQVGIWNGGATPSGILATGEGEWGRRLLSNTGFASLREMRYLSLKYKGLEEGGVAFNTTTVDVVFKVPLTRILITSLFHNYLT